MTPALVFCLEHPDPAAEAAIGFVFDSLGLEATRVSPDEVGTRPHVLYGDAECAPANAVVIPERPGDVVWPEVLAGAVEPAAIDGRLPFDLVAAIGAFLRDDVHRGLPAGSLDAHGRLTYAASLPDRLGHGATPIVNVYVDFLGRVIRERCGIAGAPRWPDGKAAAIGLSHDVDLPDRYGFLRSLARPWRLRRQPRTNVVHTVELARSRMRDPAPSGNWAFDRVIESEAALGFRSTFFFATVPFHAPVGSTLDVAYDAGTPRFRDLFASLRDQGVEIGLHASYRAFEDGRRFAGERARLGELAGCDVEGIRHHYWHLGPDVAATLRAHEEAGFGYDTSLAFNEHPGFRRSVALPFHVYDEGLRRPLRTIELPTFCMDGSVLYRSSDVDAAVTSVARLVDEIARTGGIGVIDWHSHTSYPVPGEFHAWGVAYQEILRLLASRSELWVTNLGEIASWTRTRTAQAGHG